MLLDTSSRSAAALTGLVHALNPQTNAAFFSRDGLTFCNDFANAVTAALGCPIPIADETGKGLLANDQHDWLASDEGKESGWRQLLDDADGAAIEKARILAESGFPVVAVWKNPTGSHGHIALCVPAPDTAKGHLYVAAAGAQNFNCAPIERSFGVSLHPDFFTHD